MCPNLFPWSQPFAKKSPYKTNGGLEMGDASTRKLEVFMVKTKLTLHANNNILL